MTPDMTTRYYGHKREMAGFSHTLAILMSMLRVCLEYGWSMARVCLEAGKKQPRDCIATPHSQGENATLIAQGDRPRVRCRRSPLKKEHMFVGLRSQFPWLTNICS